MGAACLHSLLAIGLLLLSAPAAEAQPAGRDGAAGLFDQERFEALRWREIGPYRGGRSAAVAGVEMQPRTYYLGATGGGVWKTTDAGASWKNVSDGFFGGSVGSVAVSDLDSNVVYVGGGEKTVRGNVSHGYGVWKSTDAGRTWAAAGLSDSHHVPRLRIHPRDPEWVYAAVLGHLYESHPTRGIYRTTDGGASWQRILHVSDDAGAVDLAMDPTNPRILYAGFWRVRRSPWSLSSGGEGSGLWKSTDGGDNWQEITRNEGLPQGTIGIVGISVSASNPDNLYAIIEAEEGGVFRSRDGGETWKRTSDEASLRQRAWYYTRIYADPEDEETVYVPNVRFHRSRDGGKSFERIETPHGDHHDLWLARDDSSRMIHGSDGGASVSFDSGATWSPQDNQPTAQIYRLSVDDHFPYRLYGGQQDNSALRISHRSRGRGISARDWQPTAGGESGHIVADPTDPEIVYGGSYGGYLTRLDHRTGEQRVINVWPDNPMGWAATDLQYRFQWNFPIFFSPHDPEALFAAGNLLFMSRDQGQSWAAISPDLTRNDSTRMGPSGGPITKDNTSVEYYGTIFAALESPLEAGVFWAGSDDGLVHLTRNFGESWVEVTPQGLPTWAMINSLEAHPTQRGGLYLAATAYKSGDFAPYLFRTLDYGATWTRIDRGIDRDHFTRVIRADPQRPGLLYSGTESGAYISLNDGRAWQPLQLNLPVVPITDMAVKGSDLLVATQGRGFWSLDDLTPLRQLNPKVISEPFHLFTPRTAVRLEGADADEPPANQGTNPPTGVSVFYLLDAPGKKVPVRIDFLQADGSLIRSFESPPTGGDDRPEDGSREAEELSPEDEEEDEKDPQVTTDEGLNHLVWDLRYPAPTRVPGMVLWGGKPQGPKAPPGDYLVRLTVGGDSTTAQFKVAQDPRSQEGPEAMQEQFRFLRQIRDKVDEAHRALLEIRQVREQLVALEKRLVADGGFSELVEASRGLRGKITTVEEALYQTRSRSPQDPLNFPIRLNNKLVSLATTVDASWHRPTVQAEAVREQLSAAVDAQVSSLSQIWAESLPAFNRRALEQGAPILSPPAVDSPPAASAPTSERTP